MVDNPSHRRSLDELRAAALELSERLGGKTPSRKELSAVVKESEYSYFGMTVSEFQRYCGLAPNKSGGDDMRSDEDLLSCLLDLCVAEGTVPHQAKLRAWVRAGRFPIHSAEKRFGGMFGIQERLLRFAYEERRSSEVESLAGWKIDVNGLIKAWNLDPDVPQREECFVYVMRDSRNGRHKIGIARDPWRREGTLKSEQPATELIAWKKFVNRKIAGAIEKALHETYKHKRKRGEWFNLDAEDLEELTATLDGQDA